MLIKTECLIPGSTAQSCNKRPTGMVHSCKPVFQRPKFAYRYDTHRCCRCFSCSSHELVTTVEGVVCTECAVVQGANLVDTYDDSTRSEPLAPDGPRKRTTDRSTDAFEHLPLFQLGLQESIRFESRDIFQQVHGNPPSQGFVNCDSIDMAAACFHAALQKRGIAMRKKDVVESVPDVDKTAFAINSRDVRKVVPVTRVSVEDTIRHLALRSLGKDRRSSYKVINEALRHLKLMTQGDSRRFLGHKPHTVACIALARATCVTDVAGSCDISASLLRQYA